MRILLNFQLLDFDLIDEKSNSQLRLIRNRLRRRIWRLQLKENAKKNDGRLPGGLKNYLITGNSSKEHGKPGSRERKFRNKLSKFLN